MERDVKIIGAILRFVAASKDKFVDLNQIQNRTASKDEFVILNQIKSFDPANLNFNISLLKQEKFIDEDTTNQSAVCMTWKGFDLLDSIIARNQTIAKQYWIG